MSRDVALMTIGISLSFGGNKVLDAVDLTVDRAALFAIIGPNGAGKTSLFNVLTRLYEPDAGSATYDDLNLLDLDAADLAGAGIFRTFQNLLVLKELSALENVMLGLHSRYKSGHFFTALGGRSAWAEERRMRERAREALDLVGLLPHAEVEAGILPFGHQRLLELARCVAADPKMILLDEPSAGMNSEEIGSLMKTIEKIRLRLSPTILLIAHTMKLVLSVSDHIAVLHHGAKIAEGRPAEIIADQTVIDAYLGTAQSHA